MSDPMTSEDLAASEALHALGAPDDPDRIAVVASYLSTRADGVTYVVGRASEAAPSDPTTAPIRWQDDVHHVRGDRLYPFEIAALIAELIYYRRLVPWPGGPNAHLLSGPSWRGMPPLSVP